MRSALAAGLCALLAPAVSAGSRVRVNTASGTFEERDTSTGITRQVYFHGVNWVRKGAPYIADVVDCDAIPGGPLPPCPPSQKWVLTDADAALLAHQGINAVRLGVMWPGAMPNGPGQFNASYFNQVERIVDALWKHEIYTIIDLYQDVLSPRICGEGAPLWVDVTQAALGGLPFPLPLGLKPLATLPNGLPNCSAAPTPIGWSSFYLSDTCGRAFAAIYKDLPPQRLGTQLALFWAEVARRFTRKDGVLAYELMNEPWVGDSIEHPEFLLHPGKADLSQLQPFYSKLHEAIRLATPVGFEHGPGGHDYDSKQALVMHNYCAIGTDSGGLSPGPQRELCDVTDGLTFLAREKDRKRLSTALIMTEFGAVGDKPQGLKEIEEVAGLAESRSPPVLWAFWAWDAFKGPTDDSSPYWGALSRSYALTVDSTLEQLSGASRGSTRFEMIFTTGRAGGSGAAWQTNVHYAPGLANTSLTVTPKGALEVSGWNGGDDVAGARYLVFFNAKSNTRVTVVIEKRL